MFRFPAPHGLMIRFLIAIICYSAWSAIPPGYKGYPYLDSIQPIPGRLRMVNFDQGKTGKTESEATLDANTNGVTWHDFNSSNIWACHSRSATGVGMQLLNSAFDHMETDWTGPNYIIFGECYMAETNMGDWTKYTVRVKQPGVYSLSFLHTAAPADGFGPYVKVSFLNGTDSTCSGVDTFKLTHGTPYDFHTWWYKEYSRITLDSGLQVIRFDIPSNPKANGPMNINYIDFAYVGQVQAKFPNTHFTAANSLSIQKIAPQICGGVAVSFLSSNSGPVQIERYDARGALLSAQMLTNVRAGLNRAVLGENASSSGVVFIRISQGNSRTEGKAYMLR